MPLFVICIALLCAFVGIARADAVIRVSGADCSRLVRHVAAADVAYRSGVDVDGNAVAPADLYPRAEIAVPDVIEIPIEIDLASRLGIPPGGDADYIARPVVANVAVAKDGRVSVNGQPLTGDEEFALAQACQRTESR